MRKAVELAPNDSYSYVTLALAEYRLGNWSESLAASSHSLALIKSGDPSSWFLMSLAHWQRGEKDEARRRFDQGAMWMREREVKNPTPRRLWSEAAELLGQPGPDAARSSSGVGQKPR